MGKQIRLRSFNPLVFVWGVLLAAILAFIIFVLAPGLERRQQGAAQLAQATVEAQRLAEQTTATATAREIELARLYDGGRAFALAGAWEEAVRAYTQVIQLQPDYRDAAAQLADVRHSLEASHTTATVVAIALAEQEGVAAATATAQALENRYQRALGLVNLQRWIEAEAELSAIFDEDPGYQEVQSLLATVSAKTAKLEPTPTPTATPTFTATPLPLPTHTPTPSTTPTSNPLDTATPTATPRPTNTPRPRATPTRTPTQVLPPDGTATAAAATVIAFQSRTPTPTLTPTATPNAAATAVVATAQAIATWEAATATAQAVAPQAEKLLAATGLEFVFVSAGEFEMGSPTGEGNDDEHPQHTVALDGYWIGKTEVTNAQYTLCVTAGGCPAPGNNTWNNSTYAEHPVTDVSWNDAVAYTRWLSEESGVEVRLPTEAEWEKAACGTDDRIYPWGNQAPSERLLNFDRNVGATTAVGSYPEGAGPNGVLDMAGNVWEWTADWYGSDYYGRSPERNPTGPESGDSRVVRGGAWGDFDVSCASRGVDSPYDRYVYLGFRVVATGF